MYFEYLMKKLLYNILFFLVLGISNILTIFPSNAQETYNLSPGKKITLTDAAFQTGSAKLDISQKQVFTRLVEFLAKRDRLNIEIGGHADNQGGETANAALSLARAESVRSFLVENGISPNRIRTKGYGSQFPIADNATAEGRTKNRRVEIIGLSALTGRLLVAPDGTPLPPEARITSIKPTVNLMSAWEGEWREAKINDELYEAFRVATVDNSWLDVTFKNNSVLRVSENTTMFVYGFEASSNLASGAFQNAESRAETAKNIELEKGNLFLKLREMKSQDTFSVRTKNSAIGFNTESKNSHAKVSVDSKERSIISVLEGRANVKVTSNDPRTGQTLDVQQNFGVVIGDANEPLEVKPLPKKPELILPEERIPLSEKPILFRWNNYGMLTRLEIGASAEFSEFLHNDIHPKGEANILLPKGTYFIRLTNIDSVGFESQSVLRALVISTDVEQTSQETPFHFRFLEFFLLFVGGGMLWASVLFKNVRLRYIGITCVVVGVVLFLVLK